MLEDLFQSSSSAKVFQLTLTFKSLHQEPGQPVLTFINEVIAAAKDLKYLGEDVQQSEDKMADSRQSITRIRNPNYDPHQYGSWWQ